MNDYERLEKLTITASRFYIAWFAFVVLVSLAVLTTITWVAIHFLSKVW